MFAKLALTGLCDGKSEKIFNLQVDDMLKFTARDRLRLLGGGTALLLAGVAAEGRTQTFPLRRRPRRRRSCRLSHRLRRAGRMA